ncbi:sigma-70 family RNA polymerase sigma factor [Nonomuraea fuscirosea]|jgi:RNA polymerase sigma-70 factor (TIGR02952 family)|uniref:RNA polymerase sigma-70 factor (ECF subfamily) n=1 Tax=Nonomuraea fuscirosea TaxID=1291556 RepID=A0A2T0MS66_9ACTN|nr:sigma-70 family RNA polymerase sigma factor [Nonomuraea fuscirosea]PRX61299.1 RNA polymerase sigma-70 factor (ECF subfamily) [Nonomuraea fuscirosea]WSA51181.1 sigma-70 family RNA polymerase sigma factor [Nonomuraea fuscirosea]
MPDSSPFAGLLAPAVAGPARTGELVVHEDVPDDLRMLVMHAKNGCTQSFGTLYDRYVDLVYRYIYFRVGSHPLAEDLTSETFLRALRRIGDFTWQGRDFGAWLVTIARNLVTDHFKSGRYRLEVTTGEVIDVPLDGSHIPENAVVTAIINDRVLRAVRDLNPEQQECVVLRFLHGLSLAETALIMGKKSGAIKALQFRAVRSLARALKHDLA